MTAAKKRTGSPPDDDSVFDAADVQIAFAQKAFTKAAKAEMAENDTLGLATHGAVGGKLKIRRPRKLRTLDQH